MIPMSLLSVQGIGGFNMTDTFLSTFELVVSAGVPYAISWRIGIYIVNVLLDWVTGRRDTL